MSNFNFNKTQQKIYERIQKAGCSSFEIDSECIVAYGKPGYYVGGNPTQHVATANHCEKEWGATMTNALIGILEDLEDQQPCGCENEITTLTCAEQLKTGKLG